MALFKSRKNDRVLDLTERYKKQLEVATRQEPVAVSQGTQEQSESSGFNFLGSMASGVQALKFEQGTENFDEPIGESVETRRKKLAKRFVDMTNQIESLSNQIYHLQQRIEVLERKSGIRIE